MPVNQEGILRWFSAREIKEDVLGKCLENTYFLLDQKEKALILSLLPASFPYLFFLFLSSDMVIRVLGFTAVTVLS